MCQEAGCVMCDRQSYGVVTERVVIPQRPSVEYLQLLRRVGASEETIRRASGEQKPRRWWWKR